MRAEMMEFLRESRDDMEAGRTEPALKALELDHSLAEPHATLGVVKRDFEWDWPGAEEEFQRAIDLNPGCVDAYHWRGTLFSMLGQHADALREKSRALELDPLSLVIRTDLGRMFYFSRDYDRSLEQYLAALDMDPNFVDAHQGLAFAYKGKGMEEESISEWEQEAMLAGTPEVAEGIKIAFARGGYARQQYDFSTVRNR